MRGKCMFELFKEIKKGVNKFDEFTANNKFMSNPFNEIVNQTFVWTEKPSVFERIVKK